MKAIEYVAKYREGWDRDVINREVDLDNHDDPFYDVITAVLQDFMGEVASLCKIRNVHMFDAIMSIVDEVDLKFYKTLKLLSGNDVSSFRGYFKNFYIAQLNKNMKGE